MVAFRRAKTLKDVLVRAKVETSSTGEGACVGCHRSNCQVCQFLNEGNVFSSMDGTREFMMRKGVLNCNSNHVVYLLSCKTCRKQYVGSTTQKFRGRFNLYKSCFRAYCKRKADGTLHIGRPVPQAGLFEHFLQEGHHGMEDWSFQIIDTSWNLQKLREREAFWQYRLNTFLPEGLNDMELPTDLII